MRWRVSDRNLNKRVQRKYRVFFFKGGGKSPIKKKIMKLNGEELEDVLDQESHSEFRGVTERRGYVPFGIL